MIFVGRRIKRSFLSARLKELDEIYQNPGRGWYHIYTIDLGKMDREALKWLPFEESETVALLRLDIRAFRQTEIENEALSFAREVFDIFRQRKKDLILRIVYDTEGRGMVLEPDSMKLVLTHMRQLGTVVCDYAEDILVSQGLFVGNWGEMHGSKFLSAEQLLVLAQTWYDATEGRVPLAFRKPAQCRAVSKGNQTKNWVAGLYDDAILGENHHLGTFGTKSRAQAAWEDSWCVRDELEYLEPLLAVIPCGGEAVAGENCTAEETLSLLRQLQISYLNCVHGKERLTEWQNTKWQGKNSLYRYIGNHLGYRFVVTKAKLNRDRTKLCVTVANRGFARCYRQVRAFWFLEGSDKHDPIDFDMRQLAPGEEQELVIDLKEEQSGKFFLCLLEAERKRVIRFANQGAAEQLLLGTLS